MILIYILIYLSIGGLILGFAYDPKDPEKNERTGDLFLPILLFWPIGIPIKIGSWIRKQVKGY